MLLFAPGLFLAASQVHAVPEGGGFDINAILTYLGLGAGGITAWKVLNLLLDKVVPSRSDKRNEVETSLNVLSRTIEILAKEKAQDAIDLLETKKRVRELEDSGANDYDIIRTLRSQVDEYERRIIRKDEHISQLTRELGEYGALVTFDRSGHLSVDTSRSHPNTGPIRLGQ